MQRPDYLVNGEIARLIPVIADSRKEQRAASALLSIFSAVPDFANAILSHLGQKITPRTTINTFTEISLKSEDASAKDRPDGLIEIQRGKQKWAIFVEAKIGRSALEKEQLERYLRLAKDNSIDALLTVSNEFASRPNHHPVPVSKALTKRVGFFHLSWTAILTEAILLHENAEISDPEQAFLIREFVRFLSHESVGVNGYTSMPPSWKTITTTVQSGGNLSKNSQDVESIVMGWHQEARDLSLQLSQYLARKVQVRLLRKHSSNPEKRISDDIALLAKTNTLRADFSIPDAASDLVIIADLRAKVLRASMTIEAPKDKKKTITRTNWLLRQLRDVDPTDVIIRIKWASSASDFDISLTTLREDPKASETATTNALPRAFEVILNKVSGRRLNGRKTFIEDVEVICPQFYERIGQHLKNWQPSPPKPKHPIKSESIESRGEPGNGGPLAGNEHTALLEIPLFCNRMTDEEVGLVYRNPAMRPKIKHSHPSRFRSHLIS